MSLLGIFVVLCAASGHTLGTTLKPVTDMNIEDSVLYVNKKINDMEERLRSLESKASAEEIQKAKDEILVEVRRVEKRFTEIESSCTNSRNELSSKFDELEGRTSKLKDEVWAEMSDKFLIEKNKLLVMDNHLLFEVHQLQKKALETHEKITHVENEIRNLSEGGRMKTDLLQTRLNETRDLVNSCLSSQRETTESMEKNIETLKNVVNDNHMSLTSRMGNVQNSMETLEKQFENLSSKKQEAEMKLTVKNNTIEINGIKQELIRFRTLCSPPCENGGTCVKNVCNCPSMFTGKSCQIAVCSPPCKNDGQCMINNICICAPSFVGDRCQDVVWQQCGVDFDSGRTNGSFTGTNRNPEVWPWMAALYTKKTATSSYLRFCDGSVIHQRFILASAQCRDIGSAATARLGLADLNFETYLQEYNVRSVHIHPQYRFRGTGYAIALLELEKPIEYNFFVRPICLPPKEVPQENPLYKPRSSAKVFYKRYGVQNMTVVPPEDCIRILDKKELDEYYPSSDLVFCGVRNSSLETCHLMFGSPMIQSHLAADNTRIWTVVGFKCYCLGVGYFYSPRIQNLMQWVNETIEKTVLKR